MNFDRFFYGLDNEAYNYLGSHLLDMNSVEFSLWCDADEVYLCFDDKQLPMNKINDKGIFSIILDSNVYKYEYIIIKNNKTKYIKDIYSFNNEETRNYHFFDYSYLKNRINDQYSLLNICKVNDKFDLDKIIANNHSHILINIDSYYDDPELLCELINRCHINKIGVIISLIIDIDNDSIINISNISSYLKMFIDILHVDGFYLSLTDKTNNSYKQILKCAIDNINDKNIIYISDVLDAGDNLNNLIYGVNYDWMNDTLDYFDLSTEARRFNHKLLVHDFNNYNLLPLSINKNEYSEDTYKLLLLYFYTYPGKKLFLNEIDNNTFERKIGFIHGSYKGFNSYDYERFSFKWIVKDNYDQSVYVYARFDEDYCFVVVLNIGEQSYKDYRVGVPFKGTYTELINTNNNDEINKDPIIADTYRYHELPYSISFDLPSHCGIIFSIKLDKISPIASNPKSNKKSEEVYNQVWCKESAKYKE